MSMIRREGLDPARVEESVKVLILDLHQDVRPIDGPRWRPWS